MTNTKFITIEPGDNLIIGIRGLGTVYTLYTKTYVDDLYKHCVDTELIDDVNGLSLDVNSHYLE